MHYPAMSPRCRRVPMPFTDGCAGPECSDVAHVGRAPLGARRMDGGQSADSGASRGPVGEPERSNVASRAGMVFAVADGERLRSSRIRVPSSPAAA
jgi:hypothetical protein